jgi:hypothetical protein
MFVSQLGRGRFLTTDFWIWVGSFSLPLKMWTELFHTWVEIFIPWYDTTYPGTKLHTQLIRWETDIHFIRQLTFLRYFIFNVTSVHLAKTFRLEKRKFFHEADHPKLLHLRQSTHCTYKCKHRTVIFLWSRRDWEMFLEQCWNLFLTDSSSFSSGHSNLWFKPFKSKRSWYNHRTLQTTDFRNSQNSPSKESLCQAIFCAMQ